jgi:hypothetical protein
MNVFAQFEVVLGVVNEHGNDDLVHHELNGNGFVTKDLDTFCYFDNSGH